MDIELADENDFEQINIVLDVVPTSEGGADAFVDDESRRDELSGFSFASHVEDPSEHMISNNSSRGGLSGFSSSRNEVISASNSNKDRQKNVKFGPSISLPSWMSLASSTKTPTDQL